MENIKPDHMSTEEFKASVRAGNLVVDKTKPRSQPVLFVEAILGQGDYICAKSIGVNTSQVASQILPVTNLQIQLSSTGARHIWQSGLWFYFEDETEALSEPHPSLNDAIIALRAYGEWLNSPK